MMTELKIISKNRTEFLDITAVVQDRVSESGWQDGILLLFTPHTTAALTINENADPDVPADLLKTINKIVPFDDHYLHAEGNSAAHLKSSLFGAEQLVIVENGRLKLGTWQALYFCEFDGPRQRKIWLQFTGT
jgi:secondary thiamine-phosphate synthase enzyme